MNTAIMHKLIYSAVIVLVIHLLFWILKHYAKQTQKKFGIRKSRYFAAKRLLTIFSIIITVIALILVWNVNFRSLWGSITGILAMIAIAFFAVWSLVGNILAGIIIYFTSPFKIEDNIEIMPDEIRGTVLAINTFYTVLTDEDGNYINIPNSLFFQRYIKLIKTKRPKHKIPEKNPKE